MSVHTRRRAYLLLLTTDALLGACRAFLLRAYRKDVMLSCLRWHYSFAEPNAVAALLVACASPGLSTPYTTRWTYTLCSLYPEHCLGKDDEP